MEYRKIPFSPPDVGELEIEYISKAVKSGWITTGPRVKELEKKIAGYIGVNRCVCLNSQTACGEMALRLLGIGSMSEGIDGRYGSADDEVITCAYTYTASASVVHHVGAKLKLVDCQKNDVHLDYEALENAINEKTKAIIAVDLGGIPCDYDRIFEIVKKKKSLFKPSNALQSALGRIAVISDAAHAFGGIYKGKMIGSIADFTGFSFHAVKNFTTAEGGALSWRSFNGISDDEIYRYAQLYSLHGQSKDAYVKAQFGSWEYDIEGLWYKCNMTDITAAMGLAQFERYPAILKRRREIIEKYDAAFKQINIDVARHYTEDYLSSGHLYFTFITGADEEKRNRLYFEMGENGVMTNVHYKPLPLFTGYQKLGFIIKDYPNAYNLYKKELTLPLNTCLTNEDVDYIIEKYRNVIGTTDEK
ncbi:MAG: DegT/DnrJ/EryC1/StrS family aminotransferase [Clostridiales bacterium]|nr:DegT/DnrJ/EryC1/StrS family aminotransferase [Clostridiales bacterium]